MHAFRIAPRACAIHARPARSRSRRIRRSALCVRAKACRVCSCANRPQMRAEYPRAAVALPFSLAFLPRKGYFFRSNTIIPHLSGTNACNTASYLYNGNRRRSHMSLRRSERARTKETHYGQQRYSADPPQSARSARERQKRPTGQNDTRRQGSHKARAFRLVCAPHRRILFPDKRARWQRLRTRSAQPPRIRYEFDRLSFPSAQFCG